MCKSLVRILSGAVFSGGLDRQWAVELMTRISEKKINEGVKLVLVGREQCRWVSASIAVYPDRAALQEPESQ